MTGVTGMIRMTTVNGLTVITRTTRMAGITGMQVWLTGITRMTRITGMIDLLTNCVAVIFRVKVGCIASVGNIKIWL